MELTKLSVEEFARVLGSDAPAPGGGSAAALAGVLGASLAAMVCALTAGKKKYAEFTQLAEDSRKKALGLQAELLDAIDLDTAAFEQVSAAYGLPKGTVEEKAVRSAAIQKGLTACIESPLAIMQLCEESLRLAKSISNGYNLSAASDLGVCVLMLRAGLLGAWLNVKINLGSLKDRELAEVFRRRGEAILSECLPLAEELYAAIEAML